MKGERYGPTIWDRFEAEPGHARAVDQTQTWLEGLPPKLGPDALEDAVHGRGPVGPTLATDLAAAGLSRWAAFAGALERDPDDLQTALAKALLFQAALALVITSTREDLLEIAKAAFDPYRSSEHSIRIHLGQRLAANASAKTRLKKRLSALIEEGQSRPDRLTWRARERELEPVPPTTQLLWSNAYSQAILRHGWAYEALRVDPKAYAALLHALPVGLAHTTVMFASNLDLLEIVSLLEAAPAAFSKGGVPVASGAVYALLERAHRVLAKLDADETKLATIHLVDVVLSRRDARWMARSWCQRVLWEVSHQRQAQAAAWPLPLFNALTTKQNPLSETQMRSWIQAEKLDLWQVDRLLVEVAILLDHDGRASVPGLLEWALGANVVSSNGRLRALSPDTFESNLIAQAFAGADLRGWFMRVWEKGYARRERFRSSAHRKIDDTGRVSLIWALAALNAAQADQAESWEAIFVGLREVHLLDQSFAWIGEDGAAAFRFAGALGTVLAATGTISPDRLTAFIDLVVAPTVEFATIINLMAQQNEAVALHAARAVSDDQVLWALERGISIGPPGKPTLNAEALERVRSFAAKLA